MGLNGKSRGTRGLRATATYQHVFHKHVLITNIAKSCYQLSQFTSAF